MAVGAFLDAGMDFKVLKHELAKLNAKGWSVSLRETRSGAFRAQKFSVHIHGHSGSHGHEHVSLADIGRMILTSRLHAKVKALAIRIFRMLGRAEARVHGIPIQKVHFHEVGAIDSIVDIVSAAICVHHLGIRRAFVRSLAVGRGLQRGSHGAMPIPVPGAYELLKGFWISQADYEQEMVTPTGAAILAAVCQKGSRIPAMKTKAVGYGAGDRKFGAHAGFMRVSLGDIRGVSGRAR